MSAYLFRLARPGERHTLLIRGSHDSLTADVLTMVFASGLPQVVQIPNPGGWDAHGSSDHVLVVRDDELGLLWIGNYVCAVKAYRIRSANHREAIIRAIADFVEDGKLTIEEPICSD